ncbi:MAG: hypothetical protein OK454_07565, partial [Thaumarchaeota archaeon]|nr:hypothetical protein [Nitrososphaerota archaeon]
MVSALVLLARSAFADQCEDYYGGIGFNQQKADIAAMERFPRDDPNSQRFLSQTKHDVAEIQSMIDRCRSGETPQQIT